MANAIHHINWLVHDIKASSQQFNQFLQQNAEIEYLPGRDVDTARYKLGDAWLVLVAPRASDSTVGRILEKRGEGLFLLSISTFDVLSDQQLMQMDPQGKRQGINDWLVWDVNSVSNDTSILQLHVGPDKNEMS